MEMLLHQLKQLDTELLTLFGQDEPDSGQLLLLINNREQILQQILQQKNQEKVSEHQAASGFRRSSDFKYSPQWLEAINRTKKIVGLMQLKTDQLGRQLKKYRHGNQSVQLYTRVTSGYSGV